jgi:hypothetical protein
VYFFNSLKVDWRLADPSKVSGNDSQIYEAFLSYIDKIRHRAERLNEIAKMYANQPASSELASASKHALAYSN